MDTDTRVSVAARLQQIVELRRLTASLDPPAGLRLWRVARALRLELGDSIPKMQAARALGISVKALDKWVARGEIPAFRRRNVARSQAETDAILDLLEEVTVLREQGAASNVIATAIRRLRESGRLRPKLMPNQSPAELRREYRQTTPLGRLRAAADLSYVLTTLASAGAER